MTLLCVFMIPQIRKDVARKSKNVSSKELDVTLSRDSIQSVDLGFCTANGTNDSELLKVQVLLVIWTGTACHNVHHRVQQLSSSQGSCSTLKHSTG